jgi:hypothetical protein
MGWGFRHFLFEADGTMRQLSQRVADGVVSGSDYLPQYAGFTLRHASVILEVEDKKPVRISDIQASKWRFDYTGSMRDFMFEAIFAAQAAALRPTWPGRKSATPPSPKALAARAEFEEKYRWTPSPLEINQMIHAIWPKDAGRLIVAPPAVQGVAKKRVQMTREAKHAIYEVHEHLYKISRTISDLSDQSLKAFRQEATDNREAGSRDEGGGTFSALWEGLVLASDAEATSRARWKNSKGNWYAVLDVWKEERKGVLTSVEQQYEKCSGKKAAIVAGRELLTRNAMRFDDGVRVEVELYPEGEWFPPS